MPEEGSEKRQGFIHVGYIRRLKEFREVIAAFFKIHPVSN
jgi:hypothetical protein